MEKIGSQKIWSYYDDSAKARSAANLTVRAAAGHSVKSYFSCREGEDFRGAEEASGEAEGLFDEIESLFRARVQTIRFGA
jgi:hypothetical protein